MLLQYSRKIDWPASAGWANASLWLKSNDNLEWLYFPSNNKILGTAFKEKIII
jgi:hypothetical protein